MSGSLHNSVVALEFVQMCVELFVRGVIGQRQSVSTHWASVNRETVVVLINTSCSSCFPLPNCKTRTKKHGYDCGELLSKTHTSPTTHSSFLTQILSAVKRSSRSLESFASKGRENFALGWKVKARRKRHLRSWLNLQHLRY